MPALFRPSLGKPSCRSRARWQCALLRFILTLSLLYAGLLVASEVIARVARVRNGPVALTNIFALYLALPIWCSLVILLCRRRRSGYVFGLLTLVNVGLYARPGPGAHPNMRAGTTHLSASSWNLLFSNDDLAGVLAGLRTTPTDVTALLELSYPQATAIARDPVLTTRYPHRLLRPQGRGAGMGLLSVYPIVASGTLAFPVVLWARLALGDNRYLTVVSGHPNLGASTARHFDSRRRDASIQALRKLIDPLLRRHEPLLVLGDFNVTAREPGYRDLTAGLVDAAWSTHWFPPNTWKTEQHKQLSFGLLRIDYLLSSRQVMPLNSAVDCTPRGTDHCLVRATFALPVP